MGGTEEKKKRRGGRGGKGESLVRPLHAKKKYRNSSSIERKRGGKKKRNYGITTSSKEGKEGDSRYISKLMGGWERGEGRFKKKIGGAFSPLKKVHTVKKREKGGEGATLSTPRGKGKFFLRNRRAGRGKGDISTRWQEEEKGNPHHQFFADLVFLRGKNRGGELQ